MSTAFYRRVSIRHGTRPAASATVIAVEVRVNALAVARAVMRGLRELAGWEVALVRTTPLSTRPTIPLAGP